MKHQIEPETMAKAEEVLQDSDFEEEKIRHACVAAAGMYSWIMAIRNKHYIHEKNKPKEESYLMAKKQHHIKNEQMQKKREELAELEANLLQTKTELESKEAEIKNLEDSINASRTRKERALKLFEGLSGEEQKWVYYHRILVKQFYSVQADVLLGAGIMSYLRIFSQKQRDRMEEKWKELIRRYNLKLADDFNFNAVFGDQISIREWVNNGLPSDTFSIENAIILTRSQKY